jgi:hypothetical protein
MAAARFWKGTVQVSAEMIGTMALFTCALATVIFAIRPRIRRYKKIDLAVFDMVKKHTTPSNTRTMVALTKLGKHQFLIPANLSLIYYFLFIRRHSWFSIRIAAIALSSLGLMFVFKYLFHRKRPVDPLLFHARGMSFPSGHAIMSMTFFGLLMYIASQTVKNKWILVPIHASLATLIAGIGFSRVYLRVHYASDVAVGYIIGFSWLIISLDLLGRIEQYNKEHGVKLASGY